ncbi:deoxyribonuclease IV [Brevibacillus laterosporus]|uniref:Deoxyribonuclease IV n=1 Tax=Brevibacillus laterosporus TaxID=1465 RepID=A0AAP3DI54_BRELA|nr:deoxyribonuclease IV [Brevibacillus laterosporus]ATO50791.1 endonuclease IV [Brevibacillus laterosporus DSM 25]MBG9801435.1 endonuclease IV [Brevibacillus laterosporus]MCR8981146.1 deoxyribonuclease IV [Brevibacillus laterosporus]MCZ0808301.1 deoxyribonuclease IV [Brevibacillus laterosporus]MCZ0826660.1 deoxyribonuclease IV [Brevibacillus laterosporus]
MHIGCHVSVRQGYTEASRIAKRLGGSCYQYFPKNPRSLQVKSFSIQDAHKCRDFCEENGMISIAHTPYPTNLCIEGKGEHAAMVASVRNDLEIADACGSIGVVVHFGQYKGNHSDPLYGYQLMIHSLNEILEGWTGNALILLENNAGQGNKMGLTLEELVQVRALINRPELVGFCLDTCHAFASGLWTGENWIDVQKRGEELGYFTHLKAVHLNDSRYPTGSYRDRHADIGWGEIGVERLGELIRSMVIREVPLFLETPGERPGGHKAEIAFVKQLFGSPQ